LFIQLHKRIMASTGSPDWPRLSAVNSQDYEYLQAAMLGDLTFNTGL